MKYAALCLLFLLNSEIFSLIALNLMLVCFLCDCLKARFF